MSRPQFKSPLKAFLHFLLRSLLISLLCQQAHAQWGLIVPETNSPTPDRNTSEKQTTPDEFELIRKGVAQSRNLLGQTASTIGFGLDSLFGAPNKNQPNESAITLRSGLEIQDSGLLTQINTLSFQADLPTASSKLQLLARLGDEHELENRSTNVQTEQTPEPFESRILKADKAGIFLRYIYQHPESLWQTTFDNGFQFTPHSLALEPVSYLRIGQTFLSGTWQIRPVPVIYWAESSGLGTGIALHTLKPIDAITSLQHTTGVNYLFDEQMAYYQHGWQLVQAFTQDLRATSNITFYSTNRAGHLIDEAKISATLRRRIDSDWLFFSVTPADTLSSENNYKSNLSITFQLEAKFGVQY
ncbi:hypothetical protein BTA35_0205065 [Oceanospirillum linum]|uniref:DUF481 domain-containing protein n=1 Tax=Oceanospirillum linum TaxID=966 RepID=A0A1T1HGH0_OCELI|nr:hypothetical protein BTA35_0205065 [Oceanospirillum linum]